jgi:16S rRNA (cytosine967-C5)-methyltransferase
LKPRPDAGALRAQAAEVVAAVCAGASLDTALPAAQAALASAQDRGLLQAICYGVLRDRRSLEHLVNQMLQRPTADERLQALLLVGVYQLRSMRIAPHAAVSETVAATTQIDQLRARGMVNAILRRYQREHAALEQAMPQEDAIRFSHPDWLLAQLRVDWPGTWPSLLQENQTPGPMTLRVNRRRGSRDNYLARLAAAGIEATPSPHARDALTLADPVGVEQLPGFAAGDVSVQDAAAQLATGLLELPPASSQAPRILDACAAPGGKSAHLLESADVELLALDRDAVRLRRVEETLLRLGLQAECRAADAATPDLWWDGRPFDRILIDAPCSGTGVIRRHPDIKWLRRERDIPALAATQQRLLQALWPLLAPGGVLLYATCSLLRAEGEAVMEDFVHGRADAEAWPITAGWGESCGLGRRIASGEAGMDGFYYARLRKRA